MRFEEALICMRERIEVKYRNDVYYIDKKNRLRVRYSDVEMGFIPSFTAEQIMSEDWKINMLKKTTNKKDIKYKIPKNFYKSFQKELSQDAKLIKELLTTDKLNKTENFNISKGNVKEDNTFSNQKREEHNTFCKTNVAKNVAQRNSQDDELMKKIFPHKEVINGKIVSVFPYIEEVYPLKDVPQEVVSKMEKTIDHIADVNKKVSLTELWKKGELEEYKKYYCKTKWFEDIFQARCYNKDTEDEWWVLENEKYKYNNVYHTKDIEVLAPAPSFEEYNKLQNSLEHEKVRATHYYKTLTEIEDENEKLEELLKECREWIEFMEEKSRADENYKGTMYFKNLLTKIDEVLK